MRLSDHDLLKLTEEELLDLPEGNYSDPNTKNPESCLKKLYINPNEIK